MILRVKYSDPNMPVIDQESWGEWLPLYCRDVTVLNHTDDCVRKNMGSYPEKFCFRRNDEIQVHLGIEISFPIDYEIHIIPINNLFRKSGLIMQNSFEVIDYNHFYDEWVLNFLCMREFDCLQKYTKVAQFRLKKKMAHITVEESFNMEKYNG